MNIPIKTQDTWSIAYDEEFGTWFKRKTTFIIDLESTVLLANAQCEQSILLLNTYEIYINKMKEKKARKARKAKAKAKANPTHLDKAAEKEEANKAGYDLFPIYDFDTNFKKCVKGYHLINSSPINETIWEDINSLVFSSLGIKVHSKSDGSHSPGMDINCSLGGISNKSAKYSSNKKSIDISSYRLTTVCSEKRCGEPKEIIEEINKRKNFDYYSFIVRDESDISYDWLLIPSNYLILDPSSYSWEPTIGKRGKKKDVQIGWNTNKINGCKMSITFSMSSQLWIHIEMEEIKKFIIASATVVNKPKYNYMDLLDILG
jgi:hypothetical protein